MPDRTDPTCPFCRGRGFAWDYDDYDGFYALCSHCGGSGHLPPRYFSRFIERGEAGLDEVTRADVEAEGGQLFPD